MRRLKTFLSAMLALVVCGVLSFAATLTGTTSTQWNLVYRGSNDLGSPSFSLNLGLQPNIAWTSGTGNNQGNALFTDTRGLSGSSSENLDLAGSLVDPLGTTLTFLTVKGIKVCADAGNAGNIQVGGAASNTFIGVFADPTDIINVKPGGCFVWLAPQTGATVTGATGDILKVNNSGASSANYSIWIFGTQ